METLTHLHSGVLAGLPLYCCALCLVQDGLSVLLKDVVRLCLRNRETATQQGDHLKSQHLNRMHA